MKAETRRRGARAPKDEWEEEEQGKHFIHPNSRSPAPAENTGNDNEIDNDDDHDHDCLLYTSDAADE